MLAAVLTSAITIAIPAAVINGGITNLATLPPAARAAVEQGYHTFQNQYIAELDHVYTVTFGIATIVAFLYNSRQHILSRPGSRFIYELL